MSDYEVISINIWAFFFLCHKIIHWSTTVLKPLAHEVTDIDPGYGTKVFIHQPFLGNFFVEPSDKLSSFFFFKHSDIH